MPKLIRRTKVTPVFPARALGKRTASQVALIGIIHRDGSVGEIRVLEPAGGYCGFQKAAIDGVLRWRYEPATKDGEPVDAYFSVVIDFVPPVLGKGSR